MVVWNRDKWCVICGKRGEEVHHVTFRSQGGKDVSDNLVLLCKSCHKAIHDDYATADMIRRGIHNKAEATEYLRRYIKNKLWRCSI